MKAIDIPPPVKIMVPYTTGEKEETFTFVQYLRTVVKGYEPFMRGAEMARTYGKIMDAIDALNGAPEIQFEDSHFELVKSAANAQRWATPDINLVVTKAYFTLLEKPKDVKAGAPDKK